MKFTALLLLATAQAIKLEVTHNRPIDFEDLNLNSSTHKSMIKGEDISRFICLGEAYKKCGNPYDIGDAKMKSCYEDA